MTMTMTHSSEVANVNQNPGPTDMSDGVMTPRKGACRPGWLLSPYTGVMLYCSLGHCDGHPLVEQPLAQPSLSSPLCCVSVFCRFRSCPHEASPKPTNEKKKVEWILVSYLLLAFSVFSFWPLFPFSTSSLLFLCLPMFI